MKVNNKKEFEQVNVFGTGAPNTGYAQYFTGESFLNPLTEFGKCPVFLANVTFEPGCRNNWHIHHATSGGGQILVCTAGEGWYQEEGKPAVSLTPGTVITIPANVKHCMERKLTAGLVILLLKFQVKMEATSGVNRFQMKNINVYSQSVILIF